MFQLYKPAFSKNHLETRWNGPIKKKNVGWFLQYTKAFLSCKAHHMCCLVAKFLCLPFEPRLYNYKFRSTSSFFLILMRTTGGWSLRMWHIMRSRIESRELTTTQVRKSMEWKSRHFSNERKMSCDKGKERQVFPSKCSWAVTCKIEFTFEVFWVLSKVPEKNVKTFISGFEV